MSSALYSIAALVLSALVLLDLHLMNKPQTAVRGNHFGAIAMAAAGSVCAATAHTTLTHRQ